MNTVLVNEVVGSAWIRNADGSRTQIQQGMRIPENAEIITENGAFVVLSAEGMPPLTIGENREFLLVADVFNVDVDAWGASVADPQAAAEIDPNIAQVLAALEEGVDPFEVLDPTAAVANTGRSGGASDGGSSFTRIMETVETTRPLAFDYSRTALGLDDTPELSAMGFAGGAGGVVAGAAGGAGVGGTEAGVGPAPVIPGVPEAPVNPVEPGVPVEPPAVTPRPNLPSNTPGGFVDTTPPEVTVTINDDGTVSFAFSEEIKDFDLTDVIVANGTLGNLTQSGNVFTADLTVDADFDGQVTVEVPAGSYTDMANNAGLGGSAQGAFDTLAPTVDVTVNSDGTVSFEFSEAIKDFDLGDVTVTNGVLSNLTQNGNIWIADLTVNVDLEDDVVITVPAGSYSDMAGNVGLGGSDAKYFDTLAPEATITIDPITDDNIINSAESGETIAITGTVGGDVKAGDTVTVTVSGKEYETKVAATGGMWSVDVAGSELAQVTQVEAKVTTTDTAGNATTKTAHKSYSVDTLAPDVPTAELMENGTLVKGNAEAGSTVRVTDSNGQVLAEGKANDGNGDFTLTLAPALSRGDAVNVTATDAAGNSSAPTAMTYVGIDTGKVVSSVDVVGWWTKADEVALDQSKMNSWDSENAVSYDGKLKLTVNIDWSQVKESKDSIELSLHASDKGLVDDSQKPIGLHSEHIGFSDNVTQIQTSSLKVKVPREVDSFDVYVDFPGWTSTSFDLASWKLGVRYDVEKDLYDKHDDGFTGDGSYEFSPFVTLAKGLDAHFKSIEGTEGNAYVLGWDELAGAETNATLVTIQSLEGGGEILLDNKEVAIGATGLIVTREQVEQGLLSFKPTDNESGFDGYEEGGVGDQQEDYAKIIYSINTQTSSGLELQQKGELTIDIRPIADAPDVTLTVTPISDDAGTVTGSEVTRINGGSSEDYGFDIQNGEIVKVGSNVMVWLGSAKDAPELAQSSPANISYYSNGKPKTDANYTDIFVFYPGIHQTNIGGDNKPNQSDYIFIPGTKEENYEVEIQNQKNELNGLNVKVRSEHGYLNNGATSTKVEGVIFGNGQDPVVANPGRTTVEKPTADITTSSEYNVAVTAHVTDLDGSENMQSELVLKGLPQEATIILKDGSELTPDINGELRITGELSNHEGAGENTKLSAEVTIRVPKDAEDFQLEVEAKAYEIALGESEAEVGSDTKSVIIDGNQDLGYERNLDSDALNSDLLGSTDDWPDEDYAEATTDNTDNLAVTSAARFSAITTGDEGIKRLDSNEVFDATTAETTDDILPVVEEQEDTSQSSTTDTVIKPAPEQPAAANPAATEVASISEGTSVFDEMSKGTQYNPDV